MFGGRKRSHCGVTPPSICQTSFLASMLADLFWDLNLILSYLPTVLFLGLTLSFKVIVILRTALCLAIFHIVEGEM